MEGMEQEQHGYEQASAVGVRCYHLYKQGMDIPAIIKELEQSGHRGFNGNLVRAAITQTAREVYGEKDFTIEHSVRSV